jgi:hypothetical protein
LPKEKEETNFLYEKIRESAMLREKARLEQNRKQIKASRSLVLAECLKGKKRKLAHEYVIFYRRGNYLIEGETSPINRSLISSHLIHPSLRDLRDSLSRTCGRKSSLSLSSLFSIFSCLGT